MVRESAQCRLGFRPKCLICGDDILALSACCCLAACLYSLDTTRRLSVIPTGLVKTFTAFSNCSTNLAPRLRGEASKQLNCLPMTFG